MSSQSQPAGLLSLLESSSPTHSANGAVHSVGTSGVDAVVSIGTFSLNGKPLLSAEMGRICQLKSKASSMSGIDSRVIGRSAQVAGADLEFGSNLPSLGDRCDEDLRKLNGEKKAAKAVRQNASEEAKYHRRPSVKELASRFELASQQKAQEVGSAGKLRGRMSTKSKRMTAVSGESTQQQSKEEPEKQGWTDAAPYFSAVCEALDGGELVRGANFSYYEAMCALEVMDPKMDAGMGTSGFQTLDEAIQKGAAPADVSVLQAIDIFDHLMACEATWHNGDSLAQTVFTCLYMHKLDHAAPNALLHAFCKVIKSTCCLVRSMVSQAEIHEEEELVTLSFGLPIDLDPDRASLSTLNAVEETVARQLKACRKPKDPAAAAAKVGGMDDDGGLDESVCKAVLCRLRFRKALYHALINLDKPQGRGLDSARKHITAALAELANIRGSEADLAPSPTPEAVGPSGKADGEGKKTQKKGEGEKAGEAPVGPSAGAGAGQGEGCTSTASGRTALGFDEGINRRLLAPTPPRVINMLTWHETLNHFEKLLRDLDIICQVPQTLSLTDLHVFALDFAKGSPGPLARARLQLVFLMGDKVLGKATTKDLIWQALHVPPEVGAGDAVLADWVSKAGRPMAQLLKILCMNPARQRRKLARALQEWDTLLLEAETVQRSGALLKYLRDNYAESFWTQNVLLCWVVEQTCRMVLQYLLLGFKLDLYVPSEYLMVYWYVDRVMLTLQSDLHAKEEAFFHHEASKAAASEVVKRKGSKKKKGGKAEGKEFRPSPQLLLLECHLNICKGLTRMLCGLRADNKLGARGTPFNTEEQRYNQRFEALAKVHYPDPLHYTHFRRDTDFSKTAPKRLYHHACEYFAAAQRYLTELQHVVTRMPESLARTQRLAEIRQIDQVARRNTLAASIINQVGPKDLKLSFDLSQHPYYVVAVLKAVEANNTVR